MAWRKLDFTSCKTRVFERKDEIRFDEFESVEKSK